MATLRVDGDNTYKQDHFKKDKQCKAGTLPISFTCPPDLIVKGRKYLDIAENGSSAPAAPSETLVGEDVEDTLEKAILNHQQPQDVTTASTSTDLHDL